MFKKLEWVSWCDGFEAGTPFGCYHVEPKISGKWIWRYCFDEVYDEEEFECKNADEGKRLSFEHWYERIKECVKDP